MLSEPPHLALSWAPYHTMDVETLVFWMSDWLKTACVLSALFWVAYRAYQVLSKPVEDLIALLGLEVPVAPTVSLAGIRADGVLLHWKPPDPGQRASVVKYIIRINGIDIGDVSQQESSVTIENLQPDHQYVMRIVTVNSANFQAPSSPIRVRTLPAASGLFYGTSPAKDSQQDADAEFTPTPIIRPNKNIVDIIMNPTAAPPVMTREHSNSTSRVRRVESGRRNSPASLTAEQAQSAREAADTTETIKQLTEKLDGLRREIEDVEKQIQEEEDEFQTQRASLLEKRDEKKAALKEKEDTSRDLRKEVATLERSNASAQARRANQERLLRQKEAERKKLKDDVARWTREAVELRSSADSIEKERVKYEEDAAKKIQELKEKHAEEVQENKSLEEVLQEKRSQIKALEKESEALFEGDAEKDAQDPEEAEAAEESRQWATKFSSLQQGYVQAYNMMCQAERTYQEVQQKLQSLQQRRLSQPQLFGGVALQDAPVGRRRNNSQRSRPVSVREPFMSTAPGGFVHTTAPSFNSSVSNVSPQFPNATPYFNINNGMALPPLHDSRASFSQAEIESLTGGAPMSPTAGALLPSGLFGDDSGLTDAEDDFDDPGIPMLHHDSMQNLRPILPGLGAPGAFDQPSPSTPVSAQGRSPFASPRDSGQLGYFPEAPTELPMDSDRRSIHSTSSSMVQPPAPTTRFGSFFGINRQRGKTLSDGPALGSLKPSQSQSLPRQDPGGLDPIGTQRRRGSTEGAWYNHILRSSKTQPVEPSESPKHVATRKRAFNMFGSKSGEPWPSSSLGSNNRPASPRQGSTNSGEASLLPRPSTDSHTRFGWPGSADALGARNSPLGYTDWSMPNNSTPWSRVPSRRPSLQHGSTLSLANEDLLQGDLLDFPSTSKSPTQAPIGTRPQSSASYMPQVGGVPPTPPKALNPAAPHFTSIFNPGKKSEEDKEAEKARKAQEKADKAAEKAGKAAEKAAEKEAKKAEKREEKKASKAEKSEKAIRKDKERLLAETLSHESGNSLEYSRSISTTDMSLSEFSPRVSLERTVSLASSDAQMMPGKETFMQKLSRKSSSSQFLQFSKGSLGKTSLFKKSNEHPSTPVESEEGHHAYLMPKSVDSSAANSPQIGTPKDKGSAFGWSSLKRMGKRGDKTPSLHESIASETTGDEDDVAEHGN